MQHAKKGNEVSPVCQIILSTLARHRLLALGILLSVCGAILTALVPPLGLARIIDTLTLGTLPPFFLVLFYFIMLTLTGLLESAREGLLTVCGQKITHALRSRLMGKFVRLSAEDLNRQEPGAVVSRFVGDAFVDKCLATVNYKLDNYSNLMAFLKQNLSDAIVFWREEDVEKQVLLWCALQSKQPVNPPSNNGDSAEDDTDINPNNAGKSDVNSISGEEDDYEADDDLFESPDFEPIDIEPSS